MQQSKVQMENHLGLLERHLRLNTQELKDYLKERYFEQMVPIVFAEDTTVYYDIIVE